MEADDWHPGYAPRKTARRFFPLCTCSTPPRRLRLTPVRAHIPLGPPLLRDVTLHLPPPEKIYPQHKAGEKTLLLRPFPFPSPHGSQRRRASFSISSKGAFSSQGLLHSRRPPLLPPMGERGSSPLLPPFARPSPREKPFGRLSFSVRRGGETIVAHAWYTTHTHART